MSKPNVSVVTVTYNSASIIGAMLSSLPRADGVELVVVDNASHDDTVDVVRSVAPSALLRRNVSNRGFAYAVNVGVAASSGEIVLLLNPDARITPDALSLCLAAFADQPGVGVVAPLVDQPQGRLRTLEAGRAPSLWRVFTHWAGLSRLGTLSSRFEGYYLRPAEATKKRCVDWVSGSCMFIRRSIWDEVGGMSERYFMYAEDVEFCLRVRDAGHHVLLLPGVTATHEIGSSSTTANADFTPLSFAWFTNTFDLYRSRYRPGLFRLWLWRTTFAAGLLSRAAAYWWRSRRDIGSEVDWGREARKFYRSAAVMNAQRLRPVRDERSAGAPL